MLAINLDGSGDGEDTTGPTDDAHVFISTTMLPQDPYCCAGPDEDDEGEQCQQACQPLQDPELVYACTPEGFWAFLP